MQLVMKIHKGGFTHYIKMVVQIEVIRTVYILCSSAQHQSGSQAVQCQAPML